MELKEKLKHFYYDVLIKDLKGLETSRIKAIKVLKNNERKRVFGIFAIIFGLVLIALVLCSFLQNVGRVQKPSAPISPKDIYIQVFIVVTFISTFSIAFLNILKKNIYTWHNFSKYFIEEKLKVIYLKRVLNIILFILLFNPCLLLNIFEMFIFKKATNSLPATYLLYGIYFLIFLIYAFHKYKSPQFYFYKAYKIKVISEIIKFIDPELMYYPENRITPEEFYSSCLFKTQTLFFGDDLIIGKIGKTSFKLCEIKLSHLFHGMFFIGDFNKNFKERLVIIPENKRFSDVNKVCLGKISKVKLEDPLFEKYFKVYGIDQVESRYILSPSLMKRITDYKDKAGKDIYISFVNNKIFIAMNFEEYLLEPNIMKTFFDFDIISDFHDDLMLWFDIVEELNLNTRIWTRE